MRPGRVPAEAYGFCDMHYQRWKKHGDPSVVVPGGRKPERVGCEVEGCTNRHAAKGFCEYHYKKQKKSYSRYQHAYRKMHGYGRKYRTGWTTEEYNSALEAQGGYCAMCDRPATDFKRPLHADHCHRTGAKRALLCPSCNSRIEPVLTRYFSDPDLRRRWQQYLAI